jgi:hypothetical protein
MRNNFGLKIGAVIAKSFLAWLYSNLLPMKVHRLIVRTLLLISLLSTTAFGSRISAPSCPALRHDTGNRHHHQMSKRPLDVVLAAPAHRPPANRMHRLRGKRINLDTALVLPPALTLQATLSASTITLDIDSLSGPNPPRGPPALSSI